MKHLISLSLKYIKRQKMRSFLTFSCIMISVFILSSVCAYSSSIFRTTQNQKIEDEGSWEIDMSQVLESVDDLPKAIETLEKHAYVSDMYYSYESVLNAGYDMIECGEDKGVGLFDIAVNGKSVNRKWSIDLYSNAGSNLMGKDYDYHFFKAPKNKNEVILPRSFADELGFSKGDEIELTITPFIGIVNEDMPQVKEIKNKLIEENKNGDLSIYMACNDMWTLEELGAQKGKGINDYMLLQYLSNEYSLENVDFVDIKNLQIKVKT